jgi:hypothetical protein
MRSAEARDAVRGDTGSNVAKEMIVGPLPPLVVAALILGVAGHPVHHGSCAHRLREDPVEALIDHWFAAPLSA